MTFTANIKMRLLCGTNSLFIIPSILITLQGVSPATK